MMAEEVSAAFKEIQSAVARPRASGQVSQSKSVAKLSIRSTWDELGLSCNHRLCLSLA